MLYFVTWMCPNSLCIAKDKKDLVPNGVHFSPRQY